MALILSSLTLRGCSESWMTGPLIIRGFSSAWRGERCLRSCLPKKMFVATSSGSISVPLCSHLRRFLINSRSRTLTTKTRGSSFSAATTTTSTTKENHESRVKGIPERLVEACPPAIQPYLRLSRMHQPIGTWLLFWPCTWGLSLGAQGIPSLSMVALFGIGAFVMRGAGCTINDMWDRNIDCKVKRTRDRPLAAGEVRMRHAALWLGAQLSVAFVILLQLTQPCFLIGVGSLGLVFLYPLAKRVSNWPQAVLGLTFNIGVPMGYAAASSPTLGYLATPWVDPSCLSLYLAGISWTLIYDTIYAHQDREEDALLGLGSTARRFGDNTKYWLSGFSVTMLSGMAAAGYFQSLDWPYYLALTVTASHLFWQIKTLDINNNPNCATRFRSSRHIGWMILLGLASSY